MTLPKSLSELKRDSLESARVGVNRMRELCDARSGTVRSDTISKRKLVNIVPNFDRSNVSDPQKHHYIPAFYLKQWAGEDGLICTMRKVPRGLSVLRKSPKATGFKRNLYSIDNVASEQAQLFESVFLKLTDNDAHTALTKLLHDNTGWSRRFRSAWARFIMSLIFRNPEAVAVIRDHIVLMWHTALQDLRDHYDPTTHNGRTFEEYLRQHPLPHAEAADFLRATIDNPKIGADIVNMHWEVFRLDQSNQLLMTSDRPLDLPPLGNPDAHMALPISPRHLFVAARKRDFFRRISDRSHSDIVKRMNEVVVSQARAYVWALSEAQSTFVARFISTENDRVILTDEQKQKALDAVKSSRIP